MANGEEEEEEKIIQICGNIFTLIGPIRFFGSKQKFGEHFLMVTNRSHNNIVKD